MVRTPEVTVRNMTGSLHQGVLLPKERKDSNQLREGSPGDPQIPIRCQLQNPACCLIIAALRHAFQFWELLPVTKAMVQKRKSWWVANFLRKQKLPLCILIKTQRVCAGAWLKESQAGWRILKEDNTESALIRSSRKMPEGKTMNLFSKRVRRPSGCDLAFTHRTH